MFCVRCGKPIEQNGRFCPHCGQEIAVGYVRQPLAACPQNDGYAIGALICGILSFFFGLALGIIAMVLAHMSKKENGGVMPGKAKAGFYMGLISTILIGVAVVFRVVAFGMFLGAWGLLFI